MRIDYNKLTADVTDALTAHGLDDEQAKILASSFVAATAAGVATHGVSMLGAYLKKLTLGQFNTAPDFKFIKKTGSFAVIDSDNAIGAVSAKYCMDFAVSSAKEQGIYTVFSRNCNTYGPAFYYSKIASDSGLIGITFCNTPSAMAPWNSKTKVLGTNPFAVAIPGAKNGPIMLDMATSKVAKSKINKARLAGESIPSDWALDTDGNPTTDPLEAIKGTVLPMAEYKGYGIAMAIDIIAGVLSGAGYLNGVNRFYSDGEDGMNVGQVFVAIDPRIVLSDNFYSDIDGYINQIHACEPLGDDAVLYPGERKNKKLADSLKNGVELTAEEYETIMRFKDEK